MLEVGCWLEVDGWDTVLTGFLNFRVSHNLIRSSPPRVTTSLPSELMSIPLVQLSLRWASLISALGRLYGPSPPQIDSVPSSAAATKRLFPPPTWLPHVTAVILVLPPDPASLDLCTTTCFCFILILTSQILKVLSVPAVTQRSQFVGCHAPAVISLTWPLVMFMSRRYISPLTNSVNVSPSRVSTFACGVADITRT